MKKTLELKEESSCLNRAYDDEVIFVILSRDPSFGAAIEAWQHDRIKRGLNTINDPQIIESMNCLAAMSDQHALIRARVDRDKGRSFSAKFERTARKVDKP